MHKAIRHSKRIAIGVVGGIVVIIGIIAIPYPGPGWLIVFAGLGILSTEFTWADRLLGYGRSKYDAWGQWVGKQSVVIRLALFLMTSIIVIFTVYLVNGYGFIDNWLHLRQHWVHSPLF